MNLGRLKGSLFFGVGIFAVALLTRASPQRPQERPSISYGTAKVSLGMTMEQVQQSLAGASRHMQTIPSFKQSVMVYVNGQPEPTSEGQIIFGNGRVTYADYKMPIIDTAEELAQEIAGAVDNMETKTCALSNYSAHGTGGETSQTIFDCGSRRFNVMTFHTFGSNARTTSVDIEIGNLATK